MKEARKRLAVMKTFRMSKKKSPVSQRMLKMLPSGQNALRTPAEDVVVYSLEIVLGFRSGCTCFYLLQNVRGLVPYTLYFKLTQK
jgi:hypothetical protein